MDISGDGEKEKEQKKDTKKSEEKPKPELTFSVEGQLVPGADITLTAVVKGRRRGERLTLALPQGFSLVRGDFQRDVPPTPEGFPGSPVTWTVKAKEVGEYQIKVTSSYGLEKTQTVRIETSSLSVIASGVLEPGAEFTIIAYVKAPRPDERLTLILPKGFSLVAGKSEASVPPSSGARARVSWKVKASAEGGYTIKVKTAEGLEQPLMVRIKPKGAFGG
jgi:hypothetical protein